MLSGNRLPNGSRHFAHARLSMRSHLLNDDESLFAVGLHGESRAAVWPDGRGTLLDSQLDVLRVMVSSPDDNQIFQTARDEQLSVM